MRGAGVPVGAETLVPRWPGLGILAILLLGALLRLWNLGGPSLWIDEIASVGYSRLPVATLWSDWMVAETNPPLYYTLLKVWSAVWGDSETSLRALSALLGTASIYVIYQFARRILDEHPALWVALFSALTWTQVYQGRNVRGYALGLFFAMTALIALVEICRGDRQKSSVRWFIIYAVAVLGAFYCHTTLFLLPVIANLYYFWCFVRDADRRLLRLDWWIAANLLALAGAFWWVRITFLQITGGAASIDWIAFPTMFDLVATYSHLIGGTGNFGYFGLVQTGLCLALGFYGLVRIGIAARLLLVLVICGVPFVLLTVSLFRPIFLERTVFWTEPAIFCAIAAGAAALPFGRWRRVLPGVLALVLFIDSAVGIAVGRTEPWREIAAILREEAGPKDLVVVQWASRSGLNYYCERAGCGSSPVLVVRTPEVRESVSLPVSGTIIASEDLPNAIGQAQRVWLIGRFRFIDDLFEPIATLSRTVPLAGQGMTLTVWTPRTLPSS